MARSSQFFPVSITVAVSVACRPNRYPRRNPLVKVAADTAEDMMRFAGEFGLTATQTAPSEDPRTRDGLAGV